jgi:hypothetical protein
MLDELGWQIFSREGSTDNREEEMQCAFVASLTLGQHLVSGENRVF